MSDLERQFWTDIRAALLQIAAAILKYKLQGLKPSRQEVEIMPADSIAGAVKIDA